MSDISIQDLTIDFHSYGRVTHAVRGISFDIPAGKTLAIVGESGSGKSVTSLALTRLLPPSCKTSGKITYKGKNLLESREGELRKIRGKDIAYIFQEPSTSLNPVFTVGYQIAEAVKLHLPHVKDVKKHVVQALESVGIRDAQKRYSAYPHELSGGMQQRVMIAMALACEPGFLIADEPTTALDVTIQKQIIDLMKEIKSQRQMGIVLITHNFGIVSGFVDEVIVMFRGQIVERGPTDRILQRPEHPYTQALINCIPKMGGNAKRLKTIDYSQLSI